MKKQTLALALALSSTFLGCQNKSDSLAPPPIQPGEEKIQADGVKIEINPRVDVIFVIDDSGSMKPHQANLIRNTKHLVAGFGKDTMIDVHIGVTTVWDSERYGAYDPESNQVIRPGVVSEKSREGKTLFYPIGHLRPLKAPAGKEHLLAKQPPNYVTKGEDFVDILSETLNVGVTHYVGKTTEKEEAQGPEFEETFSPVMAALREPVASAWNNGFHRNDELNKSHLVVIFLTDANDASRISADQMYRFLVQLKGRDNFTVFGVVNPTDQKLNCARDPAGPPYKLESLIKKTQGKILNICGDYASQLLEIGKIIQDKTLSEIRIRPQSRPVVDTIQVTYGSQTIPFNQWEGWTYDGKSKSIVIRGAAKWPYQPNAKIGIDFERVDPTRQSSHCIGCPSPVSGN